VTLTAANLAILDTSVYIDNLRSGRFKQEILDLKFVVRLSAVVLAELSRGDRSREMKRFVDDLAKNLRIIAPNEREWIQSGRIVNRLVAAKALIFTKPERFISTCSSRSLRDESALISSRATSTISPLFVNSWILTLFAGSS